MNLLLIYPQLVDKPKRRLSRENAQLAGLTHTTRALFERGKTNGLNVREYPYESYIHDVALRSCSGRKSARSIYKNIDLVIDISPASLVNIPKLIEVPIIHLSPTFSGSFACNDITIEGCGQLKQSDVLQCIKSNADQNIQPLPSTHELDVQMHNSTFAALPTRVGDAFYRTPKEHALVLLNYCEQSRNDQTIAKDIQVLRKNLKNIKELRSIT